ncbi:unnamed protein product, partial [Ectocarpus sp. 13 AM-2016]
METSDAGMPTAEESAEHRGDGTPTPTPPTGAGASAAAMGETDSRRISKHKHTPNRGDDGRGKRPRKGDAKRERKKKALAHAAEKCEYYFDDHGLRRVRPYIYDFQTHAKERWLGRTVVDVFSAEFGGEPRSHYENAIRGGLLTVNGSKVGVDYELQNSDLICNRTHRHEPPVCGGDIPIVSESAEELVVDKPCTVPIHPCGSYRFNTLFYIMHRQRPDLTLRVCHRLDRLTSGLTIFAKTAERAGVIQKQIGSGGTRKTYLARVSGDFGQRLPLDRRKHGSPSSSAAAAAAARAGGGGDTSPSPPEVTADTPPEEGGNPSEGGGTGDERETSPVVSSEGGGPGPAADELWWRYESLGEGVVKGRLRSSGVVNGEEGGLAESSASPGGVGSGGGAGGEKEGVTVRVNCPIRVLDPKHGVYECHPSGKEAQTV